MAAAPKSNSLRLIEPAPRPEELESIVVEVPNKEIAPGVTFEDGAVHVEHDDGSVTVDFDPKPEAGEDTGTDFYRNLTKDIDEGELGRLASELIDSIQRDIDSRKEWLETRARGIQLLGLKLEEPRGDIGTGSAPLEGMSTVRHPLLLEATIRFQAMARGELLPATGPVKVRNDSPPKTPSRRLNSSSHLRQRGQVCQVFPARFLPLLILRSIQRSKRPRLPLSWRFLISRRETRWPRP